MRTLLIADTFDNQEYNKAANHPMQTWQWGEARRQMGLQVLRAGEFDTELKHVFQMTIHPIPKTPYKIGYIPRSVIPSLPVLDFIYDCAREHNIVFVKFEPDAPKDGEQFPISINNGRVVLSPKPLFPEWTQVLDLTPSEEDLLKKMKPKTRYNIKLAQKKGVTIIEDNTEHGFEVFSKLYFETTKRQKYYGHNREYHETIWRNMKDGIDHILIAYYENEPLAAYELFYQNGKFYYPYGGTSELHRNVMAANLLMWEAIRLGKKLGATEFDMWGSMAPDFDDTDPWAGFTRFKEGYGTTFVNKIGSYDLVVKPQLYTIYNIAYSIRHKLLQIFA